MSSVIIAGNTSGTITLDAPAVAGTTTLTLPTTTSTLAINGPAFSAYSSVSQTGILNATWTKQTYDTELWDTNSNFASSRFTPTVAGYYLFTSTVLSDTLLVGRLFASLYKNGVSVNLGAAPYANSARIAAAVSCVAYANGSSDYFEIYALSDAGVTWITNGGSAGNFFQATMVRGA